MRKDASLLCVLLAIMLLSAIFAPPEPIQNAEPPEEEVRIGDVAEVAEIDPVKDVKAPEGYYRKTRGGWAFVPEAAVNGAGEAAKIFDGLVNARLMESAAGLAIIALPFAMIIRAKMRKKRKASDSEMKRISGGTSQAEFQALIRKLSSMEQILQNMNLLPENVEKQKGRKRKWI